MPQASGVFKQVSFKRETTFNTAAGASGFALVRRTASTIDLTKDTYQSNERRSDMQVNDFRHGVRRVSGGIQGELAPGAYTDFLSALVRRDFTAGASATGLSITVAGSGPTYTITRGSGSWITDGFKSFDVVRLTAGSFTAGNLNKNLMVVSLTATVLTVVVLNGSSLTAEGPIASATCAVQGKKTYAPASGHTDVSYNIEHWYADISQSELFTGVKFAKADINLPPTGIATLNMDAMGCGITTATSRYGTSPTAAGTTGVAAAVNGVLLVGGSPIAIVTGLQISIAVGLQGDPVVGSNTIPFMTPGRILVTGQFTAYFQDATLRDLFINETESSLAVALTSDNTAGSKFVMVALPRIKVGGAAKDDNENALVQTLPFTALYNSTANSTADATTVVIQDSDA